MQHESPRLPGGGDPRRQGMSLQVFSRDHFICGASLRIPVIAVAAMTSTLACQRLPVSACARRPARVALATPYRVLPLPHRLGQPLDSSAALLRPAAVRPCGRSSRPQTVAQAASPQAVGTQRAGGLDDSQCAAAQPLLSPLSLRRSSCCRRPPSRLAAVAAAAASQPEEQQSSLRRTLGLGLLFGLWYLFNIQFNM